MSLPPIVPLVLAHAPSGWTAARSFGELVEGPEDLLRALAPMVPDFAPLIEDLTERIEDELRRLEADAMTRLALLLLRFVRSPGFLELCRRSEDLWKGTNDDFGPAGVVLLPM